MLLQLPYSAILRAMLEAVYYSCLMVDFSSYPITIRDYGAQVYELVDTLKLLRHRLEHRLAYWSCYLHVLGFPH
jgi:hypothetical protein